MFNVIIAASALHICTFLSFPWFLSNLVDCGTYPSLEPAEGNGLKPEMKKKRRESFAPNHSIKRWFY